MNQSIEQDLSGVQPTARKFPIEGTNLARILSDPQYRQSFHAQLKRYNPLIVGLYKMGLLPLFGVSRTVMLITTRGRKSGKLRSTPIGYFRIGGVIHLFSAWGKNTSWYKNMTTYPNDISIQVGLKKWPVHAHVLEDQAEIERTLAQFITESPAQARYLFGWEPGRDRMDHADFTAVIKRVLIIRFESKI
jgi:deazaflavin-dependent oxidoreductase (nitroreductase family)